MVVMVAVRVCYGVGSRRVVFKLVVAVLHESGVEVLLLIRPVISVSLW